MTRCDEAHQTTALLVCAATRGEIETFWHEGEAWNLSEPDLCAHRQDMVCAITGVGIPQTLGRLLPLLRRLRPALILNIGIAGAYPGSGLKIGDLVMADTEVYGDVGFETLDEPGFRSVRDVRFGADFYGAGYSLALDARWAKRAEGGNVAIGGGCTVNACAGTNRTGLLRAHMFGVAIESMEGAAVAQAGLQEGIPVCEVRAISNIAAQRDMRPENIALALDNLRRHLLTCRERLRTMSAESSAGSTAPQRDPRNQGA